MKIMLTEVLEKYNTAPAWDSGVPLAHRHGTATPRMGQGITGLNVMGINVSAVFMDSHAEGVDEDFACRLFQAQPDAQ